MCCSTLIITVMCIIKDVLRRVLLSHILAISIPDRGYIYVDCDMWI